MPGPQKAQPLPHGILKKAQTGPTTQALQVRPNPPAQPKTLVRRNTDKKVGFNSKVNDLVVVSRYDHGPRDPNIPLEDKHPKALKKVLKKPAFLKK